MKSKIIRLFLMLSLVIGIGTATRAMAASRLNIPFDFTVNGKLMKAGNYELKFGVSESDSKVFLLRSSDGKNSILVSRAIDKKTPGESEVKMIFEKNGDSYQLVAINSPRISVELPKDKNSVEVTSVEIHSAQ